ncbi:hypothetical protein ACWCYZ_21700 [Streptomyces virginiae]|uniref:hypothetical protein n=1 Tax=Streptomyces virginiae TaxID=1961 RepID=UPI0007C57EE3|nr:hypothetical protein [Streptomyces virginiae]
MHPTSSEPAEGVFPTAEEYEAVHAALRTVARPGRGGPPCTLNSLFEQWDALVREVEEGYGWSAPELASDLWCRSALARIWPSLPPRIQAVRRSELDEIDRRFHSATVGRPGQDDQAGRWWLRRVPRLIEAETDRRSVHGWPMGWDDLTFPRPAEVEIVD